MASRTIDLAQSLQNQKNVEFLEAVDKNDREKAIRYDTLFISEMNFSLTKLRWQFTSTRGSNKCCSKSEWVQGSAHCMQQRCWKQTRIIFGRTP
jgi:glycerol kinase